MDKPGGAEPRSQKTWRVGSEIDWGTIDLSATRMDAELLMMVRRAALRAARRTVGLSHLLAALTADSVASALLARELHDSWKHFHALRSYLEVAEYTPAIAEPELEQHRRTAPEGALRRAEDAGARVAQLLDDARRDGAVFALISARAMDPALARLSDRIAADRQQHSLALARYLSQGADSSGEKTA
ncbi:MAG: hypothetical protein ACR2L6_10800 [Gemmatimonadaceae bacterium]